MTTLVLALSVLLGPPPACLQQPEGWAETTFHRIYLRNGNFIDGRVIKDTSAEVIVLLKSGEMAVRRDQVDRVELIRMRSYNEKPLVLTPPKASANPADSGGNPNAPSPVVDTPEGIRKRVDMILFKYKSTRKSPDDEIPLRELRPLGEEGAVYLAASAPKFDVQSQEAIAAALIQLKPTAKVIEVLSQLLSNENPRTRGLALTVLGASSSEDDKARYAVPLLRDPDARVRALALSALGSAQDRGLFQTVGDLCGDPENDVRTRAIRIVKTLAEKHGLKDDLGRILASNLNSSHPGVRSDSASTLGALSNPGAWKDLAPLLNDPEPTVRAATAQALMTLSAPESADAVASAIRREDDHWTRVYLAGAAMRLRAGAAVDPLLAWLSDPDEETRKLAASTLQGITGQTFGLDRDRWEAWWAANRR